MSSTRSVACATAPSTRPGVRSVALRVEPGEVVVAHDLEVEARLLGGDGVADEVLGAGLLGHEGVAEARHGGPPETESRTPPPFPGRGLRYTSALRRYLSQSAWARSPTSATTSAAPADSSSSRPKPPVSTARQLEPGPAGGLDVVGRVPDEDRRRVLEAPQGGGQQVRLGLRAVGVLGRGQHGNGVVDAEALDGAPGELGVAGGRERHEVVVAVQLVHEVHRPGQGGQVVHDRGIPLAPGRAEVVPEAALDLVAGDVGHQPVASHADGAVQPVDRDDDVVRGERPEPRQGVVVRRVDESPVDVEDDRRVGGHHPRLPNGPVTMRDTFGDVRPGTIGP